MKQISGSEQIFSGYPVSPGIGIGPVHEAAEPALVISHKKIAASDVAAESARLEEALARSRHQLAKLRDRLGGLPEHSQAEIAPLIDAYLHMLGGSRLMRGIRARVQDGLQAAEAAVHERDGGAGAAILELPGSDRGSQPAPGRGGARDRPAHPAQPHAPAFPQLLQPRPGQHPGRDGAAPGRCRADPARPISPASSPRKAVRTAIPPIMLRALGLPAVLGADRRAARRNPRHARDHRRRCRARSSSTRPRQA